MQTTWHQQQRTRGHAVLPHDIDLALVGVLANEQQVLAGQECHIVGLCNAIVVARVALLVLATPLKARRPIPLP